MKILIANSDINQKWDNYVHSHPAGTIFHLSSWLEALENESGQKVIRIISYDDKDQINGIFPLQFTAGLPTAFGGVLGAKRLSSLPRTPTGGPVASHTRITKGLIEKAIDMVDRHSDHLLQIKSFADDLNQKLEPLNKYFWREIYLKEIPDHNAQIRFGDSRNHTAVKRAVNKARKNGVTYRIVDSPDDLKRWYHLYLETMRFHVAPARSYNFYKRLWDTLQLPGLMQLVVAEIGDRHKKTIIAGNILFYYKKMVCYAFNGSSRKYFEFRANDLLHWEAIFDAQKKGFKYYNFGEVSQGHIGLAAYKKKWSSSIWRLNHYYYPKPPHLKDEMLDPGTIRGVKGIFWQLLPLRLTAKLGEYVVKKL